MFCLLHMAEMPSFIMNGTMDRTWRQQAEEEVRSGGLTLNEPSSPDRVVQTDLVSPQQPQTLKRFPLGRDYLATAKQNKKNQILKIVVHGNCSALFLRWNKRGTMERTSGTPPPPPFKKKKKTVLILTNRSHSDSSPALRHAVVTLFQCPSACWVLRRGPLMWAAQSC